MKLIQMQIEFLNVFGRVFGLLLALLILLKPPPTFHCALDVGAVAQVCIARECVTLHEMFTFNKNQSQKVDMTKLELISLNTEQFNICMWWAKSATVKQIRCKYSNTHTRINNFVGIRKIANKLNVRDA